jgi:hypothetical protein
MGGVPAAEKTGALQWHKLSARTSFGPPRPAAAAVCVRARRLVREKSQNINGFSEMFGRFR